MYFPFLHARRHELLAVRAMLEDPRDLSSFVPILEPVNASVRELGLCLAACEETRQRTVVIINPTLHELSTAASQTTWRESMEEVLEHHPSIVPAFQTSDRTSGTELRAALRAFPTRDIAVVHKGAGLSNADVERLAGDARIVWHIVVENAVPTRQQELIPVPKTVWVRDAFKKLARNADYEGQQFFTDRHRTYPPAAGFGDYGCLGAGFQVGGRQPAAVAIHAVFKRRANGDIWVQHFVSDDRDIEEGDPGSKFVQAARHLVNAARRRPGEFGTNQALDAYRECVRTSSFPGLGKNKEYQTIHHFCVVLDVLSGAL